LEGVKLIKLLSKRRNITLAQIKKILPGLMRASSGEAFLPEMWDELVETRLSSMLEKTPKNRLLKAAITELSKHGFSEMSVESLCLTAKVPKGSFYRYFESKEDLYFNVVSALADELVKRLMRFDLSDKKSTTRAVSADRISSSDTYSEDLKWVNAIVEICTPYSSLLLDLIAQSSRKRYTAMHALGLFIARIKKALEERLLAIDGLLLVDSEDVVALALARLAEGQVKSTAISKVSERVHG